DGDVFGLCRGGEGRCGQQAQKHSLKFGTHENLPCFGALLIGKHLFSNNLRLKVYPPVSRLNPVCLGCQRTCQAICGRSMKGELCLFLPAPFCGWYGCNSLML